jgi:hypothetical protein
MFFVCFDLFQAENNQNIQSGASTVFSPLFSGSAVSCTASEYWFGGLLQAQ